MEVSSPINNLKGKKFIRNQLKQNYCTSPTISMSSSLIPRTLKQKQDSTFWLNMFCLYLAKKAKCSRAVILAVKASIWGQ
jgi:hypothetical protein